jgi:type II secretory pathway predicted ATPase ExeA
VKNPAPVHERGRFQRAATQRMSSPGHAYHAGQHPAQMLQSVACLVGSGKTAAVRAAVAGLDPSRNTLIYLPNPQIGVRGIHGAVAQALGQPPRFHHATLIPQVEAALAAEADERNRHVTLAIDESHLMSGGQLEAVRMLTLCRDRDYAGTCMNSPISQPVPGQRSRHNSRRFP